MAEPSSTAGITIAAPVIALTGSIFGAQYDMLLWGFVGGLVSLSYLPPMSPLKIAGSVAGSSLLAGFSAPVVAAGAVHFAPWLSSLGDVCRIAAAGVIGLCAQWIIPALLELIPLAVARVRKMLGG